MGSTSPKRKLRRDAADGKKRKLVLKPQNSIPRRNPFISEDARRRKKKKMEKKKKKTAVEPPILPDPSPAESSSSEEERRKTKKRKKPHKDHPEISNPPRADVPSFAEEEKRMKEEKKKQEKEVERKRKPRLDHPEIPNGVALFDGASPVEPFASEERKKKKEEEEKKKKKKLAVDSAEEERREKKQQRRQPNKYHPEVRDGPALSNPSPAERGKKKQLLQQKAAKDHPQVPQPPSNDHTEAPSSSSSDDSRWVETLLEPYSKDQLIDFLCDAALADPALASRIRTAADSDISHRKVFVRSLPWDATRENLLEVFSPFGPIEDCNVVSDKATGRCKGYGFVLYLYRSGAVEALKQPQKVIKSRLTHCYLASMRPVAQSVGPAAQSGGSAGHHADTAGRKIYVSNVHQDVSQEKLAAFFAKFGEIEKGPMGFDFLTGKFRGYATILYKTQDGARKALMEPYKMFEGHQLHCQWHVQHPKPKEPAPMGTTAAVAPPASRLAGAAPQSVLAAVAAAQNLSMYCQNPAYAALFSQNPLLAATAGVNPAAALNAPALAGGQVGFGGNSPSLGLQVTTRSQGTQFGQSSLGRPGGSQGQMPAYI